MKEQLKKAWRILHDRFLTTKTLDEAIDKMLAEQESFVKARQKGMVEFEREKNPKLQAELEAIYKKRDNKKKKVPTSDGYMYTK